jgi:amino acid permease
MNKKQNVIVTIVMCIISFALAVIIPGIGDAITILGTTTNPMIGFILPVIFYLKIVPEVPTWKKILCWMTLIFIVLVSIASFVQFVLDKINDE